MERAFVGRVAFPMTHFLFNRKAVVSCFNRLKKSEWLPPEQLKALQLERLKTLISYANTYIPFYRKRFEDIGLRPNDIKTLDDLRHIPLLGRDDVIDHHKDMVSVLFRDSIAAADSRPGDPGVPIPFARFRKHKLVRNTSSGSTGAPTVFYEDGSRTALNWAHELRLKNWYGVAPGDRESRMVRISTDYMPKSRVIRLRQILWNQLILPGVNLSDDDYDICHQKLSAFKPSAIWGFTSALAGLADYMVRSGKEFGGYRPNVAIGWAAPVYDHEKKVMEKAFQCPVSNIYGAREVGHIANKCPHGSFHINEENLLIETVHTDETVHNGPGEIVATTLDCGPMPFIRFRMGDVGEIKPSDCGCGRSLDILANLLGRTGEIFVAKDGRMISPNFWCRTFMHGKVSGAVRRFQVIYTKEKNLRIKIEKDTGFSEETEAYLKDMVGKNFSPDTELTFDYVPKIAPQLSGKYQMVVNESKAREE